MPLNARRYSAPITEASSGACGDIARTTETPRITVSILNYRRLAELRRTLQSVAIQKYPLVQTIVVDNDSGPEVRSVIQQEMSGATLIDLPANIGVSARNYGIAASSGDIVVTLDNDMSLADGCALSEIAASFARHPAAGCICFSVLDRRTGHRSLRDWCHPWRYDESDDRDRQTTFISEGACAFRRDVFEHIQPYWSELFINMEGADLALRMLNAGFGIWYTPSVRSVHSLSAETRDGGRDYYHNPKNLILLAYRNFPEYRWLPFLMPRLAVLGFCSFFRGYFLRYVAGVRDACRRLRVLREVRKPVRHETIDEFMTIRRHGVSLLSRFRHYWLFVDPVQQ